MFLETTVDDRISLWRQHRDSLENCDDPFQRTLDFWNNATTIERDLPTWNSQAWPTPWELIKKNRYCPIAIPLMIGWSLKLTTRFTKTPVLIKICIDQSAKRYYNLVEVEDRIINYRDNAVVLVGELLDPIICQEVVELS